MKNIYLHLLIISKDCFSIYEILNDFWSIFPLSNTVTTILFLSPTGYYFKCSTATLATVLATQTHRISSITEKSTTR